MLKQEGQLKKYLSSASLSATMGASKKYSNWKGVLPLDDIKCT